MNAYWKMGLFLAWTIAAFAAGCEVTSWRLHSQEAKQVEAQQQVTIAAETAASTKEHKDQQATQEVSHAGQVKIDVLDNLYTAARRGLLDVPAPAGAGVPAAPEGEPGHTKATCPDRLPRSTREALVDLMQQGDDQAVQLETCQAWICAHGGC